MSMNASANVTIIKPPKAGSGCTWVRCGIFRELLFFFTWRDLKVRYKQTLLGFRGRSSDRCCRRCLYAGVQPGGGTFDDGVPAACSTWRALVAWRYFQTVVNTGSASLVNNSAMLTKIYFPRVLVPLSCCMTGLVDLAIGLGATLILMAWLKVVPALTIFLLPVFTLVMFAAAFGTSLFFAALNVRYRDVTVIVPFLLQFWMYASVIFTSSSIINRFGMNAYYLCSLNPLFWCVGRFPLVPDAHAARFDHA
jgi:lipopolysaccharide transport system permease protein